ncbi:heavy metal translocating P-type ATPase [Vibrio sp. WJH972]
MDKTCYHCGEPVPNNSQFNVDILGEKRHMCCPGCQAVAQMIVDSGLVSYYQYRTELPSSVNIVPEELDQFNSFDDQEFQSDFVFRDDEVCSATITVEGVTCAACAWLIEKRLMSQSGIVSVMVNTTTNRANIKWDENQMKLSTILSEILKLGYKAAPFDPNQQEQDNEREQKTYLYRLGIAGLATMQVMMLAFALYLEVFGDLDDTFKVYFRWVSLIFATPVLLYSALPFYMNAWRSLKGKTLGMDVPVSLALLFAYCASVHATVTEQGEVYFESVSMFTFFLLIGRYLEAKAKHKAATASGNLMKLVPSTATLVSGEQVAVKSLRDGDVIRVMIGEHLPADAVITLGETYVDESMLTGESEPVAKHVNDAVYAGTINTHETFECRVTAEKGESVIAQIVRLHQQAQMTKPKLALLADVIARYFVGFILVIAGLTWFYWSGHQPDQAFWIMLSVLVATCPCALSLATPTAITCSTSLFSNAGLLIQSGAVFETLVKANHLIVDKTGTLTTGEIEITSVEVYREFDERRCYELAAALEQYANHPIAQAFNKHVNSDIEIEQPNNVVGFGIEGLYQNQMLRIGSLRFVSPGSDNSQVQFSSLYLSLNGELIARFSYQDPIRNEAQSFIADALASGMKVTLLTGDHATTAESVAKELGIENWQASCTPKDKLDYVASLSNDDVTLMVGDGINDAPVLAQAHVSIAMGHGTDLAKTSSDLILLNDKLSAIHTARKLAQRTRQIIAQNLLWALGYNVIVLPLAVLGYVVPYIAVVGMSVSSIIVVTNSLRLLAPKNN